MFGYLKKYLQAKIHFDPQQIFTEGIDSIYNHEWKDIYPDAK